MNHNDKSKYDRIEHDELNIKSHLNTSLDLSGISVSEDLINRTLAAIKDQTTGRSEEVTKTDNLAPRKKIIAWNRYIRGFAGVAAAALIVVIGYNFIQHMPLGMKKSENTAMPETLTALDSSAQAPAAQESAPTEENQLFDANLSMKESEDVQYTITAEAGALAEEKSDGTFGEGTTGNEGAEKSELSAMNGDSENMDQNIEAPQEFVARATDSDEMITYGFRDIFIPSPEQAEYITILEHKNSTSITLTKAADIRAFYDLMDHHQFTGAGDISPSDPNYTVEMNSPKLGTLYTMLVGSNLTVRYTQSDNMVEKIYNAVNDTVLKQELEDFIMEYSE